MQTQILVMTPNTKNAETGSTIPSYTMWVAEGRAPAYPVVISVEWAQTCIEKFKMICLDFHVWMAVIKG